MVVNGRTSLFKAARRASSALSRRVYFESKLFNSTKASVKALLERMLRQDQAWALANVHSHTMWIPRRALTQYVLTEYEPFTTDLFQASVRRGDIVVDVGAHAGYFALLAARATGPSGHVFAFEPAPENLRMLSRNVLLNGYNNISCCGQAVGDRVGKASFVIAEASDSNSFYLHPLSPCHQTLTVDCVTVDSFFAGRGADVIKVDAEGAEIAVLRGMKQTLRRCEGVRLFIELNPFCLNAGGGSSGEFVAALRAEGLSVQLIDEKSRRLRPLDERLLGVPDDDPSYYANLYCTRVPK